MSLSKMIFIFMIIVFILLLVLFPEFRKLLTGWTRLFIKDMATTPEGAAAIYEEKINEAQDKYNKLMAEQVDRNRQSIKLQAFINEIED